MNQIQVEKRQSLLNEVRDLMIRMQQGDREAFSQIYEKMYPDVYRTITSAGVKNTDAEDVMQEVFIEVFNKYATCTNPQATLKWINRIAYHKAIDYMRKSGRETLVQEDGDFVFEDSELIAPIEMPEDVMESAEVQRLVGDILSRLPVAQLSIVRAFYFNDMKIHDIAEEMQIPDNTVKVYLHRARNFIEKEVKDLARNHGTRLYSVASVPLFYMLFLADIESCAIPAATMAGVYEGAISCSQIGGVGVKTAAQAGAGGTAGVAGAVGASGATGASVVTGLVAKKVAIVLAVAFLGGGTTAVAVNTVQNNVINTSTTGSVATTSSASAEEKNETAKKALTSYYNSTIVTQYGIADKNVSVELHVYTPPQFAGRKYYNSFDKMNSKDGIINTILTDTDNDGVNELLVVTVKYTEEPNEHNYGRKDTLYGKTIINILIYKYDDNESVVKELTGGKIKGPSIGLPYNNEYKIQCAYRMLEDGFYIYFTCECETDWIYPGANSYDVAWAKVYRMKDGRTEELVSDPQIKDKANKPKMESLSINMAKEYMPTVCKAWDDILNKTWDSYYRQWGNSYRGGPIESSMTFALGETDESTCPLINPFSVVDNSFTDIFSFMPVEWGTDKSVITAYNTSELG